MLNRIDYFEKLDRRYIRFEKVDVKRKASRNDEWKPVKHEALHDVTRPTLGGAYKHE